MHTATYHRYNIACCSAAASTPAYQVQIAAQLIAVTLDYCNLPLPLQFPRPRCTIELAGSPASLLNVLPVQNSGAFPSPSVRARTEGVAAIECLYTCLPVLYVTIPNMYNACGALSATLTRRSGLEFRTLAPNYSIVDSRRAAVILRRADADVGAELRIAYPRCPVRSSQQH